MSLRCMYVGTSYTAPRHTHFSFVVLGTARRRRGYTYLQHSTTYIIRHPNCIYAYAKLQSRAARCSYKILFFILRSYRFRDRFNIIDFITF